MKFNKKILAMLVALVVLIASLGTLVVFAQNAGADGIPPHIGENGNWWIGDTDTGVKAIGEKGDVGDKGEKGDVGDTGAKGEKGDVGDTGAKGEKGDVGDTGAKGETGDVGAKGDKGEVGDRGPKGEKGDQGIQGDDGRNGSKGQDAVAPMYRFNCMTENLELSTDGGKTWTVLVNIPSDATEFDYPVDTITPEAGTIASGVDGKYQVLPDLYRCALINLEDCVFDSVTLTRNKNGSRIDYTFLADDLVNGEIPKYATGYEGMFNAEETVTLTIPEDAKYLYVYYCHPIESTLVDYSDSIMRLPSEIKFFKSVEAEEQPE